MAETPNHGYNVPEAGTQDWHEDLNENFAALELDIEVRDSGDPESNGYTPTEGAKYLDTEAGVIYLGDGSTWTEAFSFGGGGGGGDAPSAGRYLADDSGLRHFTGPAEWGNAGDTDTNVASGEAATVGGGESNLAQAPYATIAGGGPSDLESSDATRNIVYDNYGTIGGGGNNQAGSDTDDPTDARFATIGGGRNNTASGSDATVGGGKNNTVSSERATVAGGKNNTASSFQATVAGGRNNTASDGDATVGGGHDNTANGFQSTVAGGRDNTASGNSATVAGGRNNTASGSDAALGGGGDNTVSNEQATVAGGNFNTASGSAATVGGGGINTASGQGATVPGGLLGAAQSDYSFVLNDATEYHAIPNTPFNGLSSDKTVASDDSDPTGTNTFSVSATGGVRFITGSANNPNVTYIPGDSAGWTTTSSRAVKTNIDPVDPQTALAGVDSMEIATWEYESEDGEGAGTTHIGPMAEEFHEAFDVGASDEHINSINADGVALAAIQGLSAELDETREELNERDERIEELESELAAKDDRIADLEARLAGIEAQLGDDQ